MTDIAELEHMIFRAEDDVDEEGIPELETHPDQSEIMVWLISHGLLIFGPNCFLGRFNFRTIAKRGNLSWCCDPVCDSVIAGMPFILFVNGGECTIELHWRCFERLQKAGIIKLEHEG